MQTPDTRESTFKKYSRLGGALLLILAPLWGYIAMFICKLTHGGNVMDTLTFYMMIAGWMLSPIGIVILLYGAFTRMIIEQRKERAGE